MSPFNWKKYRECSNKNGWDIPQPSQVVPSSLERLGKKVMQYLCNIFPFFVCYVCNLFPVFLFICIMFVRVRREICFYFIILWIWKYLFSVQFWAFDHFVSFFISDKVTSSPWPRNYSLIVKSKYRSSVTTRYLLNGQSLDWIRR